MMISTNSARWGDEDGGEQCEVGVEIGKMMMIYANHFCQQQQNRNEPHIIFIIF